MMQKGVLLILDGYGIGQPSEFNAVENAKTPTLHALKNFSHSVLQAHGDAVGLFEKELGGSEVGHTTLGAGRIVPSTAKKIKDEIETGEFEKNKVLVKTLAELKKKNGNLHLFGLMSDKNIHSDINHCLKIVDLASHSVENIFIHFVTDGRDSGVHDSLKYLEILQKHIKNIKNCHILSISGRFYAMDRENYLERVEIAYDAMFGGKNTVSNAERYIKSQHAEGIDDQYIKPVSIKTPEFHGVTANDCVLFFNFREDRLREIVKKCEDLNCELVTMAEVANTKSKPMFVSKAIKNTLSEYLSKHHLKQIKISETTKYAHVTYYLNGGREEAFEGEDRIHVPTVKTDDYAKTPKMQANKITSHTLASIKKGYDAVIVNFSNPDMIGHTGNYGATVKALECLDKCVKKILNYAKKRGYFVLITADHGNAEEMCDQNNQPQSAHTINPVMCVIPNSKYFMRAKGELKDVAPTFVQLLGLKPNKYFDGKTLIV